MNSDGQHTEDYKRRHNEIVDIAAGLFAANGYAATGVSELGEAVGLGKGALYYYIGSKQRLLSLIHDRVMEEVLASARSVMVAHCSVTQRLAALSHDLIDIITTYPDHVWVFLHEYRSLEGELATEFRRKRQEYEEAVAQVMRQGIEEKEFHIPNVEIATYAWLGMHNYTYIWFRGVRDHIDSDSIANVFSHIFLNGIRSSSA